MSRSMIHSVLVLGLAGAGCAPASVAQGPETDDVPRLGVLLVVDQLPAFLVERYDDLFTGGLRRLLDEGRVFATATHDHSVTETTPGHATISTGTHPARHGMVSNEWSVWDASDGWVSVLNVVDFDTRIVGEPRIAGASPAELERDGLADWLLDAHDDAKVVSISAKDRAAVLLAGRSDGPVVWFENGIGRFATSTHYADEDPGWLRRYNEEVLPTHASDSVWASGVPPELASRSRPDTATYEGDGTLTFFPHRYAEARARARDLDFWTWWAGTPFLDRATLEVVRLAVEAEGLGADEVPDLLSVSLSQTDRVGHAYGPLSREQLDNLLRLDAELGAFFTWLDARVGEGEWVVGFTADHGVMQTPESLVSQGIAGLRLTSDSTRSLQRAIDRASGRAGGDVQRIAGPLAEAVVEIPWIARAWTTESLEAMDSPTDSFARLERHSLYAGRPQGLLSRVGVEMQLAEFTIPWAYAQGTTHGSPYWYDRHVPLAFLGKGITPGRDDRPVSMVDVAPTLATLLGIAIPEDLDGTPRPVR